MKEKINWKKIWNKRSPIFKKTISLIDLLKRDGFDKGAGRHNERGFREHIEKISVILDIKGKDSMFEIGCGSGAFLYLFYKKGHKVGGVDYSVPLILSAKKAMPGMDFVIGEAGAIDTKKKYDFVVSNGVFEYFESLEKAEKVLKKMLAKGKKAIAVLDTPNLEFRKKSEKFRAKKIGVVEYKNKYKNLKHLYYRKEWFLKISNRLGYKNIYILDQDIRDYGNSRFRFNVFIRK